MSTKKQKFVYILALVLSFALGMLTISGCAYFSQEKVAGTVSTILEIAYVAGGATSVEQRIDQMVTNGKITEEQAVQLKLAAQKSYEELYNRSKLMFYSCILRSISQPEQRYIGSKISYLLPI
ncbi:MAG: hypothetical protein E7039_11615 [Lentisphaerae bacterium]|nr:hypothetical protein [Lentisphaerota bacterium]